MVKKSTKSNVKSKYDFKKIEKKWQKKWEKSKLFRVTESSKQQQFYVLEMYPYPSGHGIHLGQTRNYSIGDCLARFKRMQGFNVLYPMGWDSFGLPTENYAIEKGVHPTKSIANNIKTMKTQMNVLGLSYDWSREIATHEPEYYIWNQWLFLKLFENDLAYRKKALGNWCPNCKTTLANEDVKAGKCWRCDTEIIQKEIEQWFIKVTAYADELLSGLEKIDWSDRLKTLQRNWIGKSEGIEVYFKESETKEILPVFTTRPDTLSGCAFIVFAPEHPKVKELVRGTKHEGEVNRFLEKTKKMNELERISKEKEGIFIGRYAINPLNKEKIPIYIANFVLMDYGTGIIMSVPAHDQRDFEFAEKYNIPIKVVIEPKDYEIYERKGQLPRAYTGEGFLTNSGKFNGMESSKAIKKITEHLKKNKLGKRVINYKIRDWNISRQRYWGTPIPIIHCKKCGLVPVPEKDLPVELPLKVKFSKKGTPPLATNQKFVNVKCPECRGNGRRETDTMTTFVDSSWYYLRYCSPKYKKEIFDKKKVGYWMPVDQYIGGIEHAVGHLMYSRFITRFLRKSGYVKFDEPFMKLLNHGMVNLGGVKMSKSKGNIIDPLDVIKKHGADVLRTYLLFMAQPDSPIEWSGKDIFGIRKFLEKILTFNKLEENKKKRRYMESITQRKIEVVTKHMEGLSFNKALIELMDFFSKIERYPSNYALKVFLQMLSPFAPHTAEEVWNKIGGKKFVTTSNWPIADGKKIDEKVEKEEGLVNKTLSDIFHILKIIKKKPKKIILYVIPLELKIFKDMEQDLSKEFKVGVEIHAVDDKDKYDPENKSKKVKPGRPGIYIE